MSRQTRHAHSPVLMLSFLRSTARESTSASSMRLAMKDDSSFGRPGRVDAEHIGGNSMTTSMNPTSGRSGSGWHASSFTAAMTVVRPTFTSALPWAVPATPTATDVGRARPSGLPSGLAPSEMNLA